MDFGLRLRFWGSGGGTHLCRSVAVMPRQYLRPHHVEFRDMFNSGEFMDQ